jgi:hypothetical protein
MAIKAVVSWPRAEWSSSLENSLKQALECEPDEKVRERMQKALSGEPLSD